MLKVKVHTQEYRLCMISGWRVKDKYQLQFSFLFNVLLLNLAFRIWIYIARISEVWKQDVAKESNLFLSSCFLVIAVLDYKMENKNKMIIWWNNIWDNIENKNCDDTGTKHEPITWWWRPWLWSTGANPADTVIIVTMVSILKYWDTGCADLCTLFLVAGRVSLGLCRLGNYKLITFSFLTNQ